jgi:hypothetical protein
MDWCESNYVKTRPDGVEFPCVYVCLYMGLNMDVCLWTFVSMLCDWKKNGALTSNLPLCTLRLKHMLFQFQGWYSWTSRSHSVCVYIYTYVHNQRICSVRVWKTSRNKPMRNQQFKSSASAGIVRPSAVPQPRDYDGRESGLLALNHGAGRPHARSITIVVWLDYIGGFV